MCVCCQHWFHNGCMVVVLMSVVFHDGVNGGSCVHVCGVYASEVCGVL